MKTIRNVKEVSASSKVCTLLALALFTVSAQAEYYYVAESSGTRCVKRYKCVKRIKRTCARPAIVRYQRPVDYWAVPICGNGCYNYYSACDTCNNTGEYYVRYTKYAYVCDDCENNYWTPGYACCGRWIAGHWRY